MLSTALPLAVEVAFPHATMAKALTAIQAEPALLAGPNRSEPHAAGTRTKYSPFPPNHGTKPVLVFWAWEEGAPRQWLCRPAGHILRLLPHVSSPRAAEPAFSGDASYCVTCKNPDQTYLCRVIAGGAKPNDAFKLYCVIRTAKEGNHASCSAVRSASATASRRSTAMTDRCPRTSPRMCARSREKIRAGAEGL